MNPTAKRLRILMELDPSEAISQRRLEKRIRAAQNTAPEWMPEYSRWSKRHHEPYTNRETGEVIEYHSPSDEGAYNQYGGDLNGRLRKLIEAGLIERFVQTILVETEILRKKSYTTYDVTPEEYEALPLFEKWEHEIYHPGVYETILVSRKVYVYRLTYRGSKVLMEWRNHYLNAEVRPEEIAHERVNNIYLDPEEREKWEWPWQIEERKRQERNKARREKYKARKAPSVTLYIDNFD
jgi:hypothetical protein